MEIKKCTLEDVVNLAKLNKQLIEDEKSDNPMSMAELEDRMSSFLKTDYVAFFFIVDGTVIGYALVNMVRKPLYLRQFFIKRNYRRMHYGKLAFQILLDELATDCIELEVLPWNEAGNCFWKKCGFKEISRYMQYKS